MLTLGLVRPLRGNEETPRALFWHARKSLIAFGVDAGRSPPGPSSLHWGEQRESIIARVRGARVGHPPEQHGYEGSPQ